MIIRAEHNGKSAPYSIISRELLQEKQIPYGPKCMLLLMLSYPDTWSFTLNNLSVAMGEPVSTIQEWLITLHRYGYFHENVAARFGDTVVPTRWLISEYPIEVKS